jgi:hypothetical protein
MIDKYFNGRVPHIFADSGAFSAFTKGAEIDIKAYAKWLKENRDYISTYANLDVINDPESTWANQQRLEDMGLNPIPVFHVGSSWEYLERYIEHYPYIALGGMVPHMGKPKVLSPWLLKAFRMAIGEDGKPRSVYHGFGATNWGIVKGFKWYSVDSSSWGMGYRYGRIPLFNPITGKFVPIRLGSKDTYEHARLIRQLGYDPTDFADKSRYDRSKTATIGALSYMNAEQWITQRLGQIEIPTR